MAQLSVTVPDALVPRVVAAIRGQMPETAGMTDAQVGRHFLAHHVRQIVAQYEETTAVQAARTAGQKARDKAWTDTEVIA